MSFLRKILQPNTYNTFKSNSYDIDSKEYAQMKQELKAQGIILTHTQKNELKEAIKTGNLSTYLAELQKCDERLYSAMGLSLSGKIGKADSTDDEAEAVRLEDEAVNKALTGDTELLNTLKVTNPIIYERANASVKRITELNETKPIDKSTESELEKMTDIMEGIFNDEAPVTADVSDEAVIKRISSTSPFVNGTIQPGEPIDVGGDTYKIELT